MSFANLKKNRASNVERLAQAADEATGKKSFGDDRFWTPTKDKEGNARAVIRFLPSQDPDNLPWIQYYDHWFEGPTGLKYIEKSLTTIGEDDPVGELNSRVWNDKTRPEDERQKEVRGRKRRLHYVANILVLDDPANPENEGKVFMYRFGKKIFDMIKDAMQPDFDDEEPIDPFDFWAGANFKLRIRKVEGWPNYDKSEFDSTSELYDGEDDKLKSVYDNLHDLQDLIARDKFKSYAELERKMKKVLCIEDHIETEEVRAPVQEEATAPAAREVATSDDDDDEGISYFKRIAEGD